jgi:hypothetical protein
MPRAYTRRTARGKLAGRCATTEMARSNPVLIGEVDGGTQTLGRVAVPDVNNEPDTSLTTSWIYLTT